MKKREKKVHSTGGNRRGLSSYVKSRPGTLSRGRTKRVMESELGNEDAGHDEREKEKKRILGRIKFFLPQIKHLARGNGIQVL